MLAELNSGWVKSSLSYVWVRLSGVWVQRGLRMGVWRLGPRVRVMGSMALGVRGFWCLELFLWGGYSITISYALTRTRLIQSRWY